MELSFHSMFKLIAVPLTRVLLGALVMSACCLHAQEPEKIKYLAVFTSNVNVDGKSYKKGQQMEALGYDRVSQKVSVAGQGVSAKVPAAAVKVLPEADTGISIVEASYKAPNSTPRNVATKLQRKYDGQQKVSFVVTGSDFGIRSTLSNMSGGPSTGSSGPQGGGFTPQGNMGNSTAAVERATLEITFFYKGKLQTVSAPEGQPINMP